ncbi:hypothetical protein GCM10025868_40390 [Angustibacter aerolatus]|uniref:DUF4188 domain-containing protein n=1 Tax=Angustibacter aerolatus TaxID=1162965 RepID=A0ABQ6JNT5_9ACTN|nr:DUF4188 domain-containing protein [Angustibacter aerolatus]GMA88789.1 hypothetical protein GCM10025868_40390 [Angustibacter aerolatus]
MPHSLPTRRTHAHDGGVVVFMIGMRVTRWWRPDEWWPVFSAMPRMLREPAERPDVRSARRPHAARRRWTGRRAVLGQPRAGLWAYARDDGRAHRPAWRAYNARARKGSGSVGIWHETYDVPAGGHESRYVAMPVAGLAKATAEAEAASAP